MIKTALMQLALRLLLKVSHAINKYRSTLIKQVFIDFTSYITKDKKEHCHHILRANAHFQRNDQSKKDNEFKITNHITLFCATYHHRDQDMFCL